MRLRQLLLVATFLAAAGALAACGGGDEQVLHAADGCSYLKVADNELDVFKEPVVSPASLLVTLNKNAIVCVDQEQQADSRLWAHVVYRLEPQQQRKAMKGWGSRRSL